MEEKRIEIDGVVFDLGDPDGKKAAVRAWLKAKSRERSSQQQAETPGEDPPATSGTAQDDPV
jgi:hypothetical protein